MAHRFGTPAHVRGLVFGLLAALAGTAIAALIFEVAGGLSEGRIWTLAGILFSQSVIVFLGWTDAGFSLRVVVPLASALVLLLIGSWLHIELLSIFGIALLMVTGFGWYMHGSIRRGEAEEEWRKAYGRTFKLGRWLRRRRNDPSRQP